MEKSEVYFLLWYYFLSHVEETSGQNTASSSLSRRSNSPFHPQLTIDGAILRRREGRLDIIAGYESQGPAKSPRIWPVH
jgi:hypothetical protein